MITIQYGQWSPDTANMSFQMPDQQGPIQVPVADCLNVYYSNGVYLSLQNPAAVSGSPTLAAAPLQLNTFLDANDIPIPFAGTTAAGYSWQSSAWTSLGTFAVGAISGWQFSQFGDQFFAIPTPASLSVSGGALFQVTPAGAVAPSAVLNAPAGRVMGVVGQFLMIGDIYYEPLSPPTIAPIGTGNGSQTTFTGNLNSTNVPALATSIIIFAPTQVAHDNGSGVLTGTGVSGTINYETGAISVTFTTAPTSGTSISAQGAGAFRSRLHWSPIGNANPSGGWPIPLTNAALAVQSGINDLEYGYGPIMFISGYPLYGVIFQRNAITRASYIGGNVVFSWQTYARNQGLLTSGAAVQVGANTYFLSDAGFFYTDGANVMPIGTAQDNSAGIDGWFFANVNTAALSAISAGYDARKRCVFFAIPTGSNTLPDTLLTYNILAGRWTRSQVSTEMVWTDSDGSFDRLGVFNQMNSYCLLTGPPSTGYLESCDLSFSDGNARFTPSTRPNISCTDVPNAIIGVRDSLKSPVIRSQPGVPDSFKAGFAPTLNNKGIYTRVMVISAAASAINGATMRMRSGGPL